MVLKEIKPAPWLKVGLWLALAVYASAFFLPMNPAEPRLTGLSVFVLGIWGLFVALLAPFYALADGLTLKSLGEIVQLWLSVAPWLANPILWVALGHYGLGNGRAACRNSLIAVALAASCLLFLVWDSMSGYLGWIPASPAYLAWLGSMVILLGFSWTLARQVDKNRVSFHPLDRTLFFLEPGEISKRFGRAACPPLERAMGGLGLPVGRISNPSGCGRGRIKNPSYVNYFLSLG